MAGVASGSQDWNKMFNSPQITITIPEKDPYDLSDFIGSQIDKSTREALRSKLEQMRQIDIATRQTDPRREVAKAKISEMLQQCSVYLDAGLMGKLSMWDKKLIEEHDLIPCDPRNWYEKLVVWFLRKYAPGLTLYRIKKRG